MKRNRFLVTRIQLLTVFACMLTLCNVHSQDLEPRSYVNIPIDQNFFAVVYGYSEGDVNVAPSVPLEDAYVEIHGPIFGYARSFELFGESAKVDIVAPYVQASGSALSNGVKISRDLSGWADTRIRLNYNFYGAPAVTMAEFVKQEKGLVAGVSLQVSIPTGQYNREKILNAGANRWFFKPEIGFSFPWRKWAIEMAASAKIFTDNDDYVGGQKLEQDPIYNLQLHMIYDFTPKQWISFNANYFFGGTTTKDGVKARDRQENSRVGITYTLKLNSQHTLKLLANSGFVTSIGNDSDSYGVGWLYRW